MVASGMFVQKVNRLTGEVDWVLVDEPGECAVLWTFCSPWMGPEGRFTASIVVFTCLVLCIFLLELRLSPLHARQGCKRRKPPPCAVICTT